MRRCLLVLGLLIIATLASSCGQVDREELAGLTSDSRLANEEASIGLADRDSSVPPDLDSLAFAGAQAQTQASTTDEQQAQNQFSTDSQPFDEAIWCESYQGILGDNPYDDFSADSAEAVASFRWEADQYRSLDSPEEIDRLVAELIQFNVDVADRLERDNDTYLEFVASYDSPDDAFASIGHGGSTAFPDFWAHFEELCFN